MDQNTHLKLSCTVVFIEVPQTPSNSDSRSVFDSVAMTSLSMCHLL